MAATQSTAFLTPVGRLVQGDVFTMQTKDDKGQPLVVKSGPNKGQPTTSNFIAIAVPKTPGAQHWMQDPVMNDFATALYTTARAGYASLFNQQGQCTHPRFAWKVSDGDGVDNNGKSNADKPGMAGCWILKFRSSFAPKVIHQGQYITDPAAIKRGYYVRVAGNCTPNIGSDVPGLYVNHEAVELVAYGEEIRSGIDAAAVFGAAPVAALPAGATMTPPAPAGNGGLPGAPQLPPLPGAMPQPVAAAMPQPVAAAMPQPVAAAMGVMPGAMPQPVAAAPVQPNHGFVNNAMPGAMPGAMPQPVAQTLHPTAAAQGFTLQQWRDTGMSDDQLVAQGMFVRA